MRLFSKMVRPHVSEPTARKRLFQGSVPNERSGGARELSQGQVMVCPPDLGVELPSDVSIEELVYDDADAPQ